MISTCNLIHYNKDDVRKVEFPEDHLIKTYNSLDQLIRIDFLLSGNYCEIEYFFDNNREDVKRVSWSTGEEYMTWYEFMQNPDRAVFHYEEIDKE